MSSFAFRVTCLLVLGLTSPPCPSRAQPPTSDVFSSQGDYDRFAVGNAHRWYDKHATEAKQKSSHCLSILNEAKVFQDKALALYEQARQPGNKQASALVKQANEQIRLRGEKLKAFTDCVNQANRRQEPTSDVVASSGEESPPPQPPPNQENGGEKGIKRVPDRPPTRTKVPQPTAFDTAIDDCFKKSVPNYTSPDWTRFTPESLRPKRVGQFHQSFGFSGVAADRALDLDEAVYGKWQDRELMRDYLVGWLTRCLTDRKVLPMQDPRLLYRDFMIAHERPDDVKPNRITERFEEFGFGYRSYPLPPFWDHDEAGPPSPAQ
jgi:hypothetical protein